MTAKNSNRCRYCKYLIDLFLLYRIFISVKNYRVLPLEENMKKIQYFDNNEYNKN